MSSIQWTKQAVAWRKVFAKSARMVPTKNLAARSRPFQREFHLNRSYSPRNGGGIIGYGGDGFVPYGHSAASVRNFSSTEHDGEKKQDGAADETSTETEVPSSDEAPSEASEEEETASAQTVEEKLLGQVKDLKDQLLRSLAEQENTRRIAKRDVESARNFAVTSFAKGLLDTSDNLTRAMAAVDLENNDDDDHDADPRAALRTLYEGIRLTDAGLNKAFAKHGLTKFGTVGEVFDPHKHEALFEYADENAKPGTLGQVMKVGFQLNGRIIRSAEVGVIKK